MKTLLDRFRSNFKPIVLVSALALVNILQMYIVISQYGRLWISRTIRTYSLPAMERNGLFLFGGNGLEFLDFLSTTIPPNGTLVIPPKKVRFSEQNLLQFFLYPRKSLTCYCDEKSSNYSTECIECLQTRNYYIPAIGDFPSDEVMQGLKNFVAFEKDTGWYHGVYVPLDHDYSGSISPQYKIHQFLTAIIIDVFICFLIFLLGYYLSSTVLHSEERAIALATAFPVGLGVLTWLVFIVSWIGFPLTLATFVSVYIGVFIVIITSRRKMRKEINNLHPISILKSMRQQLPGKKPVFLVVLLMVFIMFSLSAIISIGRGYSLYDGISNWALKGYAIANEGSIYAGNDWGGHTLSYPQNIHLMIALFTLADGDILPGSKIAYSFFAASLLYGCFKALRRMKIHRTVSLMGVLSFFTIPIIFKHSTYGWGNFIFTTYLVLGTINLIEGALNQRTDVLFLGALLLSFGTWTRPEGIAFVAFLVFGVFLTLKLLKKSFTLPIKILLLAIIPATYFTFSINSIRKDEIGDVLHTFLTGPSTENLIQNPIAILAQFSIDRFRETQIWGLAAILIIILLLIAFTKKKVISNKAMILSLMISSVIAFIFPVAMFAIASLSKPDFIIFLTFSYDRALMPAVILSIFASLTFAAKTLCPIQAEI